MPELKIHRLTDYFLANTETWLTYQNTNTAGLGIQQNWTEKIRLDTGSAIWAVFSAFATPGCRWMFMDGGYTAAPISQDNLCVSIVL